MSQFNSMAAIANAERERARANAEVNQQFAHGTEAQAAHGGDHARRDRPRLATDALLLPGLGCASLSKDGESVIELQAFSGVQSVTVDDAERLALAEPEHEWCIHMVGLLDERHYRREGPGLWRLYARGYGLS